MSEQRQSTKLESLILMQQPCKSRVRHLVRSVQRPTPTQQRHISSLGLRRRIVWQKQALHPLKSSKRMWQRMWQRNTGVLIKCCYRCQQLCGWVEHDFGSEGRWYLELIRECMLYFPDFVWLNSNDWNGISLVCRVTWLLYKTPK